MDLSSSQSAVITSARVPSETLVLTYSFATFAYNGCTGEAPVCACPAHALPRLLQCGARTASAARRPQTLRTHWITKLWVAPPSARSRRQRSAGRLPSGTPPHRTRVCTRRHPPHDPTSSAHACPAHVQAATTHTPTHSATSVRSLTDSEVGARSIRARTLHSADARRGTGEPTRRNT